MNQDRFGGISRLYGITDAEKISHSHVAIVGIGGVGSWVAESIARTGVGKITLMDLDDLCVTNTNRQIHALDPCYGQLKVSAMAARLRAINPDVEIIELISFYSEKKAEELFSLAPDVIVDAIDSMKAKAHLIASCYERKVPLVTCGGAGGRIDASQVKLADLAHTYGDSLLSSLRKQLRQNYHMPLQDKSDAVHIPCAFSAEKPRYPQCDGSVGARKEEGQRGGIGCASGFGSATHVTACFGMMMSSAVIAKIVEA